MLETDKDRTQALKEAPTQTTEDVRGVLGADTKYDESLSAQRSQGGGRTSKEGRTQAGTGRGPRSLLSSTWTEKTGATETSGVGMCGLFRDLRADEDESWRAEGGEGEEAGQPAGAMFGGPREPVGADLILWVVFWRSRGGSETGFPFDLTNLSLEFRGYSNKV